MDFYKIENEFIKCNNDNYKGYKEEIIEIINNPKYYFYFENVKFVDLQLIKRFKKNTEKRIEKKEMAKIRKVLTYKVDLKYKMKLLENEINRMKRNYKILLKKKIKNILRKMHISVN